MTQFLSQLTGIVTIGAFTVVFTAIVFGTLKIICGVRVSERVEIEGLDRHEHGAEAYPTFARDAIL